MRLRLGVAARVLGLMGIGLACASCSEGYYARRDTLAPGAGDAVASNTAIQAINPAPPVAYQNNLATSGVIVQHAMEQYRNPTSGTNAGSSSTAPVPVNGAGVATVR